MDAVRLGVADYVVDGFIMLFLRGKFFALFSFLFGLSFFIQMDRASEKGLDFRAKFLWRLALLFIIGYLHHLFYSGDILTIYAVLGVFLIPFYKVSNKYIFSYRRTHFFGACRYLVFGFAGTNNLFDRG